MSFVRIALPHRAGGTPHEITPIQCTTKILGVAIRGQHVLVAVVVIASCASVVVSQQSLLLQPRPSYRAVLRHAMRLS
jgi:hypothetical protein